MRLPIRSGRLARRMLPAAAASVLLLVASVASADVVSIPASKDTTLFSESGALSNGAGSYFFAGETNEGALRRALVAFDVAAAVPAGSTIESVTLTLFCSRTKTSNTNVSLHRLLASWGEGASNADDQEGTGAAAASGDATWTHRVYSSSTWISPGADFVASASATTSVGAQNKSYSWSSVQMKVDVQAWLAQPSTNFGWVVIGDEDELKVAKRFDSRQNPDPSTRPVLDVTFTASVPTGACCASSGSCSVVAVPGATCSGTWQGSGSTCDPNPCPQPTGACCLADASATCVEVSSAACDEQDGDFRGTGADCDDVECPVVLEPFVDALPRPAAAVPVSGVAGGAATYTMAMREVSQKLHRDLPATRVWGFGDGPAGATYPGPTIEATSGAPVVVHWINDLRDSQGALRTSHFLPVDHCPHGAHDASARTVVHLHGGHVPQSSDGYPEATLLPGEQATYSYPNGQLPATLWYHDHALGITRLNVTMGLAGFYLLRSPQEAALGLPSGEYELPLAIQDRTLRADGSIVYPAEWQEHFFGDSAVVNGKVRPYSEVKRGKYRLRILNGATSRTWTLSLSTGASFVQIGTDGGLLPAPVNVQSLTIAPGERADVIVNFAAYLAGTEILLVNSATAPYPGGAPPSDGTTAVMKFVVLGATGHTAAIPTSLVPLEKLDEGAAVLERDFELRKGADACSGTAWLINDLRWDDVAEYPELGSIEVWRFVNRSGVMHPMHMHLVMFQVLDRQSFTTSGDAIVPIGQPQPPPAGEAGWKDTVQVGPNQIVRVIARFEDYKGKFAYHCHILEHEDHEMMRQFETVSCGDGELDPTEACDVGAANGGATACCTADCSLRPGSATCRPSAGECDFAENCTGTSPACPPDLFAAGGSPCADDGDVCTDDRCGGTAPCLHEFDATNAPQCAPTTTVPVTTTLATTTTTEPAPTTTTLETTTTEPNPTTTTLEHETTTTLLAQATCGDANGDEAITASDALIALRTAVGTGSCPLCLCDVDSSGVVFAADALAMLRRAVALPVTLDCVEC